MKYTHKITIHEQEFDTWECDCCGMVTDGSFKVSFGNDTIEHVHDGHFGSGEWDDTDYGMYGLILVDLFDAHYINIETNHSTHTMGHRPDLSGLYGNELDEYLALSPNKVVNVEIIEAMDKSHNFSVKFEDEFHLDGNIPFGMCHDEPYEWQGSLVYDLDMDKTMKFIFEKVCECLGIVIEYT